MLRAILDANVYVSAAVRPEGPPGRLFARFLGEAAFVLLISPSIIEEIGRVFAYPLVKKCIRGPIAPELWLEDILLLADLVEDSAPLVLPDGLDDPGDVKYLCAAVAGRAAFVVTGDRHLLTLVEHQGVRIVTPRAFLDLLG